MFSRAKSEERREGSVNNRTMIRIKPIARQLIINLRINLVSEKVLGEEFLVVIFSSCMLQHIFKRKAPLF